MRHFELSSRLKRCLLVRQDLMKTPIDDHGQKGRGDLEAFQIDRWWSSSCRYRLPKSPVIGCEIYFRRVEFLHMRSVVLLRNSLI